MELFELSPAPPSPFGELTVTVTCRTSENGPKARHRITIMDDWAVTTPHDLELERIAAAMGGYLSCLELVDRTIPAVRELVQARARRVTPTISRRKDQTWAVDGRAGYCLQHVFSDPVEAADHLRDPRHVANNRRVDPRTVSNLLTKIEEAWEGQLLAPPRPPHGRDCVGGPHGVDRLWDCGVHPELAIRIHDRVWADGPPLSPTFYLGVLTDGPDLDWLARSLAAAPDEHVAAWLAWSYSPVDRRDPDARARWLRAGVPRNAVDALAYEGGYDLTDLAALARISATSTATAGRVLATWMHCELRPTPAQLAELLDLDADITNVPPAPTLRWLRDQLGSIRGLDDLGLALIFAVCGDRYTTVQAVRAGCLTPTDAAARFGPNAHLPVPTRGAR